MTKLNEFTNESDRQSKYNYIDECWTSWREIRQSTLSRITNYIFVLNTGALLASLTYVASKEANGNIELSIWLFSFGILCSVIHATCDYYIAEGCFITYQKDVEEVYSNKIDWEVFVDRNDNRIPKDWYMHLLGWAGAILFFSGLVIGISQI